MGQRIHSGIASPSTRGANNVCTCVYSGVVASGERQMETKHKFALPASLVKGKIQLLDSVYTQLMQLKSITLIGVSSLHLRKLNIKLLTLIKPIVILCEYM